MNKTMKAAAIHQFGGIDRFEIIDVAIPEIDDDEILIRLDFAGLGSWDVFEREGGYAQMLGLVANFPYILGSEGAGTVARIGAAVKGFKEGDAVYASGFLNPKGGFYAQYAAVSAGLVNHRPEHLSPEPTPPTDNTLLNYNAEPDADLMRRLAGLLEGRSLRPVVSKVYPLKDVAVAHEALRQHHVGKLVLAIDRAE